MTAEQEEALWLQSNLGKPYCTYDKSDESKTKRRIGSRSWNGISEPGARVIHLPHHSHDACTLTSPVGCRDTVAVVLHGVKRPEIRTIHDFLKSLGPLALRILSRVPLLPGNDSSRSTEEVGGPALADGFASRCSDRLKGVPSTFA